MTPIASFARWSEVYYGLIQMPEAENLSFLSLDSGFLVWNFVFQDVRHGEDSPISLKLAPRLVDSGIRKMGPKFDDAIGSGSGIAKWVRMNVLAAILADNDEMPHRPEIGL